ncbi:MAG: leucyl/phenylalanyl-tRNA--protein transferase [Alteromonadaceae bacterium]|jgi:leucyl/phenylalanyl-tRNA--protein transferase
MSQTLHFIEPNSLAFPPLNQALEEPNGLLAFGGDLSPQRLYNAYSHGIFPWYSANEPIMWWSPNPRAIIPTSTVKINKTLKKILNRHSFQVSINRCFDHVIELCADAPFRSDSTWIVTDMLDAYKALHQQGHAHSIEVWQDDKLVGGLYGVAINGYFSGESMFYKASNASKVALVALAKLLKEIDVEFIDCQMTNPFLEDMGCIEISRATFVKYLTKAKCVAVPSHFWQARYLSEIR